MALEIPCPGCKATLRVREEHAGKQLKCPRCAAVLRVPGADEETLQAVRPVARPVPPVPPPEEDVTEQIVVDPPAVTAARRHCPRCGEAIAASANRCRYCRAWLDEEDEEEEEERRPRKRQRRGTYKSCPRCGAGGPARVTWTPWGSFYGPALFTHVRCKECGYGYNGRTGRSNLVPAIFMVAIPALLIIAIVVGLLFVLGIFGAGRR